MKAIRVLASVCAFAVYTCYLLLLPPEAFGANALETQADTEVTAAKTLGSGEAPSKQNEAEAINLGALVQTRLDINGGGAQETDVFLRRVRLNVHVMPTAWLHGFIQPDFALRVGRLNEAWIAIRLHPLLRVVVGRAGRPFSLIDAMSASDLLPIERGARFFGRRTLDFFRMLEEIAYRGRSTGLQLQGRSEGAPVNLDYAVGIFRGASGEDGEDVNIRQVAGRFGFLFAHDLGFGVAFSTARLPCTVCAIPRSRRGSAYNVDFSYRRDRTSGLRAIVEGGAGELDPIEGATFFGAQLWLAYRVPALRTVMETMQLEPIVRASFGDPNGARRPFGGLLLTYGINLYMIDNHRVMVNHDVWLGDTEGVSQSVKLQLQVSL